jgi:cytochrome c oxidase subunit IV
MAKAKEGHQEHPLTVYWIMWGSLFVLSAGSYATDYMDAGPLRQFFILLFMFLKAGGIVAVFMHMWWERLALKVAILLPPVFICVLIWLMAIEGDHTWLTRIEFFGDSTFVPQDVPHHE